MNIKSDLSFPLLSTAPSQPQALKAQFINATVLSVVWEPTLTPNGVVLSYMVVIQTSHFPPLITRVSADTSEEFGGLDPATMYVVTVRGMTSGGTGEAAFLTVTTLPCK